MICVLILYIYIYIQPYLYIYIYTTIYIYIHRKKDMSITSPSRSMDYYQLSYRTGKSLSTRPEMENSEPTARANAADIARWQFIKAVWQKTPRLSGCFCPWWYLIPLLSSIFIENVPWKPHRWPSGSHRTSRCIRMSVEDEANT